MRGNNISVSGPMVMEKAPEMVDGFGLKDFQPSNGCLKGWKER